MNHRFRQDDEKIEQGGSARCFCPCGCNEEYWMPWEILTGDYKSYAKALTDMADGCDQTGENKGFTMESLMRRRD